MENLYPLFERNRILKKELLRSLRDYSFAHVQLEYQDYGQGILRGCQVGVQGNELVICPGIIKYGDYICLMSEEIRVSYDPSDQVQYLKIKIETDYSSQDYIAYKMEVYLDTKECQGTNEYELCRFHLRKGAWLRASYTNFADMVTEYDTVNLIYGNWGGLGGETISPVITRLFAETILSSENSQPEDRTFAYLSLSQSGAIAMAALSGYLEQKTNVRLGSDKDNFMVYNTMCEVAKMVRQGGGYNSTEMKGRHKIILD